MAIRITGDREVRAQLRKLDAQLRRKIVVEALSKAIDPLHERAVLEAPVDTGELRAGIEVVVKGETRGRISARVIVKRSRVKYVGPVELGAPHRRREADAFLLRAFDAEGKTTLDRALKGIAGGIEREARSIR